MRTPALILLFLFIGCGSELKVSNKLSTESSRSPIPNFFECSPLGEHFGTCNYYSQCIETTLSCGEKGYSLGYGQFYCDKFMDLDESSLSKQGLLWRNQTRDCLQKNLFDFISNAPSSNCTQLSSQAFSSHPKCYTAKPYSICQLGFLDRLTVVRTIKDSLFRKETIQQIRETANICLTQYGIVSLISPWSDTNDSKLVSEFSKTVHFDDEINSNFWNSLANIPEDSLMSQFEYLDNILEKNQSTPPLLLETPIKFINQHAE